MAYPDLPQELPTKVSQITGLKTVLMGNNSLRGRFSQAAPTYTLVVVHDEQTLAVRDAVLAHLAANRAATFDFTAHETGTIYHGCRYAEKDPVTWEPRGAGKFKITTRILVAG